MSRVASIWIGLLKAGAVALVMALFGVATASAHADHTVPLPVGDLHQQHQAMSAPQGDCHGMKASAARHDADDSQSHGVHASADNAVGHGTAHHGSDHDCCKDACRCPVACAAPLGMAVQVSSRTQPFSVSVLLPGRTVDPVGLDTSPDPRPPLSI